MTSDSLADSLVRQARSRILLVQTARGAGDHHIAVREAQEVVELALKGLLRAVGVEPAKVHDVSRDLVASRPLLEPAGVANVDELAEISRRLRKEREVAFYGDVDLFPEDTYNPADSQAALDAAIRCTEAAESALARMRAQ